MELNNKNVMVYGAARSGISAARLLQRLGAFVLLFDGNTNLSLDEFCDKLEMDRIRLVTGKLSDEIINSVELVIISPGVATDQPDILRIKAKSIPIWGEIELAFRYTKGKIIGITGTNGKTTTTTLVGQIMQSYFPEVYVVGNIGKSYTNIALNTSENAVIVIELSSFQLETIHSFLPDIGAILNITPDHLDRHHTMEEYIAMKERIALNQGQTQICFLNYEDEILRDMAQRLKSKVIFFSSKRILEEGLYMEEDDIHFSYENKINWVCNVNDLHVIGRHNYENVMVAAGISFFMGIPMETIRKAILNFKAVEHRIEYVETIDEVIYYNDSKGTNPDASIKAIQAMTHPTILIAGGYDKKVSFDDWIRAFENKVKYLILLGQTKNMIADAAKKQGFENIIFVENLKEAVSISKKLAKPGDAVLLSPACASWGMFQDFEQRGNLFKEYVREILE